MAGVSGNRRGARVRPPPAAVVIGTRNSALAQRQTARVVELLTGAWPSLSCEVRPIVTRGDRTQQSGEPLPDIGGKGLFTAELEQGLREGELDLAVHSLKDLPTEEPPDMTIGAVCGREDARDCVISREGQGLEALPAGAVVGTSSLRRAAQIRALRPDLEIRSIRGNVDTRVRKVREGEFDAAVLAAAGILRLGLESEVTEWLSPRSILPAPGQGALAVQCRAGDEAVLELLAAIDDRAARATTDAERGFLRALDAGCTAPVAAHAQVIGDSASYKPLQGGRGLSMRVRLQGLVLSPDGSEVVRVEDEGTPEDVGERLAREALAAGADAILASVRGGPLRGRRIVVTRPREQGAPLAAELGRLGATVATVPLVAIEAVDTASLDAAADDLDSYDWLVFTSANAVSVLRDRLPAASAAPARTRVAAVGPATAEAVRALGLEPSFVPASYAAEEIVPGLGELRDVRVLLPQADIADPHLAERLSAAGARVDALVAYRTVSVEPAEAELVELTKSPDAIVLASGSAARSLASLADAHAEVRRALGGSVLVCIGPKTAAVALEVGLPDGLVADEATADGIIDALTSHFGETRES